MSETSPQELAEQAKQPGVFNIVDVLNNRGYPKDDVEVILDDNIVYDAAILNENIKDLDRKLDSDPSNNDLSKARDALIEKRDALVAQLASMKYVFTIKGISEGEREKMLNEIQEKFPTEYEETTNPLTGKVTREEIDNPQRNRLYSLKLWSAHIDKITAPDGSVQQSLSEDDVNSLQKLLPIAATAKISESIERLRVAAAMFILGTDEDFLAKS